MRLIGGFEGFFLLGGRLFLVEPLPLAEIHAIDLGAGIVFGEFNALLAGGILIPIRQTIAAEARQNHQIDILHIAALAQVG